MPKKEKSFDAVRDDGGRVLELRRHCRNSEVIHQLEDRVQREEREHRHVLEKDMIEIKVYGPQVIKNFVLTRTKSLKLQIFLGILGYPIFFVVCTFSYITTIFVLIVKKC